MILPKTARLLLMLTVMGSTCTTPSTPEQPIDDRERPAPTIVLDEKMDDEQERHEKKSEWIEGMHKAAPGFDWRQSDLEWRLSRQKQARNNGFRTNGWTGQWVERGCEKQSGRMMYSAINANGELYGISAGGIVWERDETNDSWIPLNDHFRIPSASSLDILQTGNQERFFAGTSGKYLFYSDDAGQTWDTAAGLQQVQTWGNIKKVCVPGSGSGEVWALVHEWDDVNWNAQVALYRSIDFGSTFTEVAQWNSDSYGGSNAFDLWSDRYAAPGVTHLLVRDSSFHWNGSGLVFDGVIGISGSVNRVLITGNADAGVIYAYIDEKIYRSSNMGITWNYRSDLNISPFRNTSFECSATNANTVYFGGVECYRSWNAGVTFVKVNNWGAYYSNPAYQLHADIPSIQSFIDDQGGEVVYVNTDAAVYRSTNSLQSVSNIGLQDLNASRLYDTYSHRVDTQVIYGGTQDQGYQRVTNATSGVALFDQLISGDYGHMVSGDGGDQLWMNYPGFTMFWQDASGPNANYVTWDFNGANHFWLPPLCADPVNPYLAYLAGGNLGSGGSRRIQLYYVNGGLVPTEENYDFSANNGGNISAMAISPIDPNHHYVLTDQGQFFHSSDAGTTWTRTSALSGPQAHYFYGASIYPSAWNLGDVYIAGSGYSAPGAMRSTNHGNQFTAITQGLPNTLVYEIIGTHHDSLLFAATELGPFVYVSEDGQWYEMGSEAPDQVYWSVDYIPSIDVARFGTHGRGIWDFRIQAEAPPVGLSAESISSPLKIHPNPAFNNTVVSTEKEGNLSIFGADGKRVWQSSTPKITHRLNVSNWPAGVYSVIWVDAFGQRKTGRLLVK